MDDDKFAKALWDARVTGAAIDPIRADVGEADLERAYAIQAINTQRSIAEGDRLVGRKIGLTSKVVQAQLGVDQPDYGMLFSSMAVDDASEVDISRLIYPRVEAEIAFVLDGDLDHETLTVADVIGATAYCLPALEIVDSRVKDWDIGIVDTIADNASSGLFVLGGAPAPIDGVDFFHCGMVMEQGGEPVSSGAGAACLGNPLNAMRWLAEKMAQVGQPLKAGDVVLSGALGPMVGVKPGDAFQARISGVGEVRVAFSKE